MAKRPTSPTATTAAVLALVLTAVMGVLMQYRDDHAVKVAMVCLPLVTGVALGLVIARQRRSERD